MCKVYIFGYLSLILKDSAGTSIDKSDFYRTSIPAKIYGFKRTWGSIRSNASEDFKRYVLFPSGKLVDKFCWATLVSDNEKSFVNGVCIEVNEDELINLDTRETGYKRIDVSTLVTPYEHFSLKENKIYTYISESTSNQDIDNVYIDADYINLGIRGAYQMDRLSPGFFDDYISSTKTPDAIIAPLKQVFWSEDGRKLYLLSPDSTVVLIHKFSNYQFKINTPKDYDSHTNQPITKEFACFDERFPCKDSGDLYYLARNCHSKDGIKVLASLNNFMIKVLLLKNTNIPTSFKHEMISKTDWIPYIVGMDLGYFSQNSTDEWSKRLCLT